MAEFSELNPNNNLQARRIFQQNHNCEDCRLKDECMVLYPCENDNKMEEMQIQLDNYKAAWNKLKDFVSDLQDGHENIFAYSNEYIENIEIEIELLEAKLKL